MKLLLALLLFVGMATADPLLPDTEYAEQTWTFTGSFGATVYGYYVVQTTSGILMWAERDASPYTPANNGDQIKLTPKITAD